MAMIFAADPPPVIAAAPTGKPAELVVVSRDARSDILDSRDTPLALIKGRRTEDALLRQVIALTSTLTVVRPAAGPGEETLRWTYQPYLQRQLCFTSITGQFSCATAEVEELPQKASGETPLAATLRSDTVEVTPGQATVVQAAASRAAPDANPAAEAARSAVVAALHDGAAVLFDDDRRLKLDPMLKAAGVAVRRPRVTTHPVRRRPD